MWLRGNRVKASNLYRNRRILAAIASATLLPLVLLYNLFNKAQTPDSQFGLGKQKWNMYESSVQMLPNVEFRSGTDLIWQIPDSPKAVLFLAHGCDGKAANFWDKSVKCPDCVGLPEERLIALNALARNFAVITISSSGQCWSLEHEVIIVKDIIRWWVERERLENLPVVALGASSGGYFVSVLAAKVNFSSVTIMIAEGKFDLIDVKENYSPVLFVHMPKDVSRARKIDQYIEVLRNRSVDVAEIRCVEFPVSKNLFSDRIPGLDRSVSAKLFELFRRMGFIDEKGFMRRDGRRTRWRDALREDQSFVLDERLAHPVQEEMNLAFAMHEMTSLQNDQIFKWFESHMS